MDKKIAILIVIGFAVMLLVYIGLQNFLKVPSLFSTPISSEQAVLIVLQKYNITQYNIKDFSTRYVYLNGDGTVYESNINSNSVGRNIGKTEPTITTGNYFAWEVKNTNNNYVYYVDSITGDVVSRSINH